MPPITFQILCKTIDRLLRHQRQERQGSAFLQRRRHIRVRILLYQTLIWSECGLHFTRRQNTERTQYVGTTVSSSVGYRIESFDISNIEVLIYRIERVSQILIYQISKVSISCFVYRYRIELDCRTISTLHHSFAKLLTASLLYYHVPMCFFRDICTLLSAACRFFSRALGCGARRGPACAPRRKFGSRLGSVARALGVPSREILQAITGLLSAELEPSKTMEKPTCQLFCSTAVKGL